MSKRKNRLAFLIAALPGESEVSRKKRKIPILEDIWGGKTRRDTSPSLLDPDAVPPEWFIKGLRGPARGESKVPLKDRVSMVRDARDWLSKRMIQTDGKTAFLKLEAAHSNLWNPSSTERVTVEQVVEMFRGKGTPAFQTFLAKTFDKWKRIHQFQEEGVEPPQEKPRQSFYPKLKPSVTKPGLEKVLRPAIPEVTEEELDQLAAYGIMRGKGVPLEEEDQEEEDKDVQESVKLPSGWTV